MCWQHVLSFGRVTIQVVVDHPHEDLCLHVSLHVGGCASQERDETSCRFICETKLVLGRAGCVGEGNAVECVKWGESLITPRSVSDPGPKGVSPGAATSANVPEGYSPTCECDCADKRRVRWRTSCTCV